MLEIVIVIAVVKGFCSLAQSKGRSKFFWGFVGAFSYYVPLLLMSFLLLPSMVDLGWLPFITQKNYFVVTILINLATGVLCCLVSYKILSSLPSRYGRPAAYRGDDQHIDSDDDNPYRATF